MEKNLLLEVSDLDCFYNFYFKSFLIQSILGRLYQKFEFLGEAISHLNAFTNDGISFFKICVLLGQSNGSWEQRLKYGTLRAFLTGFRFVFVNAFLLGFSLLITILPLGMKISIRMSLWTPNNKPRSACQSRGSLNYKQTRQSITFVSVSLVIIHYPALYYIR